MRSKGHDFQGNANRLVKHLKGQRASAWSKSAPREDDLSACKNAFGRSDVLPGNRRVAKRQVTFWTLRDSREAKIHMH
ncbi:hypothetical protein SNOG_14539 [Parastagonospora nodorum SN15]|uniref:Uncharacterized protein n=1 Tax=Phaeosphaeria nodorum (strain SN15 / ATCC MYA-4574 / FGSC 10173) TaxID=321614 RepID=Q0U122_PHANO|nr:hypothetical protein SNOG_14539 [Parastagonospora nodorum SN15]EAT78079.1 hypothetical protein SNOG_14539 [Parastagonospora nodorum SN15]